LKEEVMKEQIVTGKKFKILADVTSRLWHVISFWTKAQDVEFNSGQNAQTTLGNITGISDSLTSTSSNVAASSKAIKVLNDKIVNQIGNLNGQISQKDQTIGDLNGQINQKNQTINDLQEQVNQKNQQIDNFNDQLSGLFGGEPSITLTGGAEECDGSGVDGTVVMTCQINLVNSSSFYIIKTANLEGGSDRQMSVNNSIMMSGNTLHNTTTNTTNGIVTADQRSRCSTGTSGARSFSWSNGHSAFIQSAIRSFHMYGGIEDGNGSDVNGYGFSEVIINNSTHKYKHISIRNIKCSSSIQDDKTYLDLWINDTKVVSGGNKETVENYDVSNINSIVIKNRVKFDTDTSAYRGFGSQCNYDAELS